ncbi:MAG: hypothetical protein Q8M32_04445 [Brevundimonas sp.]|nr:hypothetical protein [Brevundimonas sp.]
MTAAAEPRSPAPRQTRMKGFAGVLAFVCLVLFLLAIEQKQAVEAWRAIRDGALPAAGRLADWASDRGRGEAKGLSGLKQAVAGDEGPMTAADSDRVLTGEFGPADAATRETVGSVNFIGSTVRLETGESFRTMPLRIAAGREAFVFGQTFADRLAAPADAQIELRRVVPVSRGAPIAPSSLCGGQAPGVIALLHRRDRVDLMLFRARTVVGADASPAALCGVWSFRAR